MDKETRDEENSSSYPYINNVFADGVKQFSR